VVPISGLVLMTLRKITDRPEATILFQLNIMNNFLAFIYLKYTQYCHGMYMYVRYKQQNFNGRNKVLKHFATWWGSNR
jgi:hypothetical protein